MLFSAHRIVFMIFVLSIVALSANAHADTDASEAKVVEVSELAMQRLQWGAKATRFARKLIPKAGNNLLDVLSTKDNSRRRYNMTREWPVNGAPINFSASRMTGLLSCTRGGGCTEYAIAAVYYLGSKDIDHPFDIHSITGSDHMVAMIGDPRKEPADQVVVIDPWVIDAEPVLLKHHFLYPKIKAGALSERSLITVERGLQARLLRRKAAKFVRGKLNMKRLEGRAKMFRGYADVRTAFMHGKKRIYELRSRSKKTRRK